MTPSRLSARKSATIGSLRELADCGHPGVRRNLPTRARNLVLIRSSRRPLRIKAAFQSVDLQPRHLAPGPSLVTSGARRRRNLVGPSAHRASMRFLEFFAANIRDPHTRRTHAGLLLTLCWRELDSNYRSPKGEPLRGSKPANRQQATVSKRHPSDGGPIVRIQFPPAVSQANFQLGWGLIYARVPGQ